MKKYYFSLIITFQAALFSLLAGIFLLAEKPLGAYASDVNSEADTISEEPPTNLSQLQSAGEDQLDYWASNLASFDGREFGYITPTRNQYNKNTCWAFAAVGAVEASILREGIDKTATKENLDLDETIAAYTRHTRKGDEDPLLLTANDTYDYGTWNQGDSAVNALAIMTQGYTLVDENHFHTLVSESDIRNKLAQSKYYVQSYQYISNDINSIKRAVLQYGAVTFNYSSPSKNKYYDKDASANHTSIIVGWDDTVDKSEFGPDKPENDGAWIIKNSWGDNGYNQINGTWCYYISYDLPIGTLCAVDLAMRDDYQNIYHYDGQLAVSLMKYSAEAQAAIYEAKLSSSTRQEQLKAVMISTSQGDLNVNVKVYKNLKVNPGNVNDKMNKPDQGAPVAELDTHIDGNGMHTVDLKNPINLEQGEYFSIVVSCKTQFNTSVPLNCAIDGSASINDMTYYFYNGEWISYKNSSYYADSSAVNQSAKIRAITNIVERKSDLGKDLQYARVEIANRLVYYAKGKQLIPDIQVYFDGKLLEYGQDYRLEAQDIDSPGMATIKLSGMGEYTGGRTTYFEVAKPKYPPGAMSGTIDVYNDAINLHDIPLPVDWEWVDNNRKLDFGKSDYPVSIKYVGADKDFYQNLTCDFYVNKIAQDPPADIDISNATVEIEGEYTYTGEQIEPSVKVIYQLIELRNDIDYILTFQNNINAGTATVIVKGNGRYFNQISQDFEIQKAERPAQMPSTSITVARNIKTLQSVELISGWEWEAPETQINSETIKAYAVYSDTANYEPCRVEITITKEPPKDVSELSVVLDDESFVYDGQEKTPEVTAKDDEVTLLIGEDYDVEYVNNKFAGQGKVIVTFKNDYKGEITLTFTIERAERQEFEVTQQGWTYGDVNIPNPTVVGEMEAANVIYTYSDKKDGEYTSQKPKNAGAYWIKAEIEQSQNYKSAVAKSQFTIAKAERPAQMPSTSITVARNIKTLQSVELISGWEWEAPDTQINSETIKAYAVYSDTANYEPCRVEITITKEPPKDVSELSVVLDNESFVYDGQEKTPEVTAKDGERELSFGTDYDVQYQNNKFAGQGKVIVTFKNDYKGTKEITFTISQAEKPSVNNTTIVLDKNVKKLSEIPLPEGFVWDDETMEIAGNRFTAKAIYQGEDASSYKITELYFEIVIEAQEQPNQTDNPEQGNMIWLAIVIPAAVLIIAGAGLAIVRHRRNKTDL